MDSRSQIASHRRAYFIRRQCADLQHRDPTWGSSFATGSFRHIVRYIATLLV